MVVGVSGSIASKYLACLLASALLGFSLLIAGCDSSEPRAVEAPPRPAGVPENAKWVGGIDGGVFAVVEKREGVKPDLYYYGEIYFSSGELWYKGALALEPSTSSFDPARSNLFSGWDGDALLLTDGRVLRAVDGAKRKIQGR